MIYLLSGLLIFHGIICLLGAFFPFYPPVFFFYVFFPGHFAIRLIIVLLAGAAQLVYGIYLVLGKKWRIRWYWLALATIVIIGLLLIFPAVQNPDLFTGLAGKGEVREPVPARDMLPMQGGEEASDDIMPTPGGPVYRANFHQQGVENPWPPIESREVVLAGNVYSPGVTYRDYMETEVGESRNNILHINTGGRGINKLDLYTVDRPAGIEVVEGMCWHGPGPVAVVLVIEVSQDIAPGQYTFEIGVKINGTDCGTVPCTIKVTSSTTPNNHIMTGIAVQPEPGQYLGTGDELSGVILKDVQVRVDVCDKDYFSPWFPSPKKGEPCLVVSGHIQNQDKEKFEISMSALGYDKAGEIVAGTLDAAHIAGAIGLHLEYGEIGEFTLHLNYSEEVRTIQVFAANYLITPP